MERLEIHRRVCERHPQLTAEDVRFAWEHAYFEALRPDSPYYPEFLWIGTDVKGRDVEMVGVPTIDGWLVYHANTPLSKRVREEIRRANGRT